MNREDDIIERLDMIIELLDRLAEAMAPTPEELRAREIELKSQRYADSVRQVKLYGQWPPVHTNAIGGPQTGRGVR